VRSLVLAEPPAHRWAAEAPDGAAVFSKFMTLWNRIGGAFRRGDKELALRRTTELFFGEDALDALPPEVRQVLEDNIREWEALTTSRDAFPAVPREHVRQMDIPTLLLTAEQTLPMHQLVNDELEHLLPRGKRVRIREATHDMWTEQPEACGAAVVQFLHEHA
jgi:pimeloyl-ACP methyl ester carboxylesterase